MARNSDDDSKRIYADWLRQHASDDCITGSHSADSRAALVEYFRDHASVMIATESAAEGVNLQFCNIVVNYDLPWNPQRIEQRIGRCHRYGQKFDVIVINFLNRKNEADQRVFELLDQQFEVEKEGLMAQNDERNLRFFTEEENKLNRWADDRKEAIERELGEISSEIKQLRDNSSTASTLAEKVEFQNGVRVLEQKQTEKRKQIFAAQDEVDKMRDDLIAETQARLTQSVDIRHLFTIRWSVA